MSKMIPHIECTVDLVDCESQFQTISEMFINKFPITIIELDGAKAV